MSSRPPGQRAPAPPHPSRGSAATATAAPREPPIYRSNPALARSIPIPNSPNELPAKYKPAATKVKLVIVALPIAIVSSYLLYKRVVLGEEPRRFEVPDDQKRGGRFS